MYLLGIDIGTSSIKVSVVEASTSQCIASAQFPETESAITSLEKGWAEQSPEMWWEHIQQAILKLPEKLCISVFSKSDSLKAPLSVL